MQYFTSTNLKHDGTDYQRGDAIELSQGAAEALLGMGLIQTEPVADVPEAEIPIASEPQVQPEVGGKPLDTGEPSLDGDAAKPIESASRRRRLKALSPDTAEDAPEHDPSAGL